MVFMYTPLELVPLIPEQRYSQISQVSNSPPLFAPLNPFPPTITPPDSTAVQRPIIMAVPPWKGIFMST